MDAAKTPPAKTPPNPPAPANTDLAGQHALVTGAGRGIGAAIAATLASAGARVTLAGKTAHLLEATAAAIDGPTHLAVLDVTAPATVRDGFAAATAALGPIDVLINNAGIAGSAPFKAMDHDHWEHMLAVNLTGVFTCCRETVPTMLERGFGRIVNICSTAGLRGYAYTAAYVASKHGVIGLTRALALETAHRGITVNAVCPGFTETDIVAQSIANIRAKTGRSAAEARAELVKYNPQGRLVQPIEVAHTVRWLCLPGTESITGQAIAVAGGEVM